MLLKDIFNLFFPNTCLLCDDTLLQEEKTLCIKCRFELPLAETIDVSNNMVEEMFYERLPIEFAASLLLYKSKGVTQKLIHKLKYRDNEQIGFFLGGWFGSELAASSRLPKIDYVVPVPIHKNKLKTRGYNQVEAFAKQIAKHINATYNDTNLLCVIDVDTQTHKQRLDRWQNVKEKFKVTNTTFFNNKSILLVDDVITTGATLEVCALQLQKSKGVKISIATMAFTS